MTTTNQNRYSVIPNVDPFDLIGFCRDRGWSYRRIAATIQFSVDDFKHVTPMTGAELRRWFEREAIERHNDPERADRFRADAIAKARTREAELNGAATIDKAVTNIFA